ADLSPSREPRLIVGVISGLRTQMTQRGKLLIVTLDDGTAAVEVTVYNEVFDANRNIFKEDEFLAVHGKVSEDRFTGGLRITADRVMDIAAARVQFGKKFWFPYTQAIDTEQIKALLAPYRSAEGLPFVLRYSPQGVGSCDIAWPDDWRVMPADALKQSLNERLGVSNAEVEY
ncbi:MAG: DNA polymerase III subunit alpha, partial [Burkholderiaceae bacterium]|nr:DNA polymerase III subunit alpha [Burkholderiaceae bacterium]